MCLLNIMMHSDLQAEMAVHVHAAIAKNCNIKSIIYQCYTNKESDDHRIKTIYVML